MVDYIFCPECGEDYIIENELPLQIDPEIEEELIEEFMCTSCGHKFNESDLTNNNE